MRLFDVLFEVFSSSPTTDRVHHFNATKKDAYSIAETVNILEQVNDYIAACRVTRTKISIFGW